MLSKDGIKMKKAILGTLLSVSALTLLAVPASAQEKKTQTEVGVQFKPSGPTIPAEDMKPYKDNLAVVFKPGSFQFGPVESALGSKTLSNVKGDNSSLDGDSISDQGQYLVVNDDRKLEDQPGGKNSPWTLKANMSELTTADGTSKLQAAKLEMNLTGLKKYNIGKVIGEDNDYIPMNPWGAAQDGVKPIEEFTDATESGVALPENTKVVLEAAATSQAEIFTKKVANEYKGGVATAIRDVRLAIMDANQDGKSFTGNITWYLNDAPEFN
jgi:hypothetical protein